MLVICFYLVGLHALPHFVQYEKIVGKLILALAMFFFFFLIILSWHFVEWLHLF